MMVLVSCEFEPSGEYSPDIREPRYAPPILIDLNAEDDTIFISTTGDISFYFNTQNRKIIFLEACINNSCNTIEYDHRSFKIEDFDVKPGTHNLVVNIFTETRSGSIADRLEAEGFFYSKSFVLVIREWSCAWSGNLSVKPDQGNLKLSWERYDGANFLEYALTKKIGWSSITLATITDQRVSTFFDNTYIGENAGYRVKLVTSDDILTANEVSYEGQMPQLHIKEVNNNLLTLAWDSPGYFNNTGSYEVYNLTPDRIYELIAKITDLNDTSYVLDNLMYLHEHEFLFLPIPKHFPGDYQDYFYSLKSQIGSMAKGIIGEKFSGGEIVAAMGDYFYFPEGYYIYEYNYVEDRVTRTIELSSTHFEFAVSANRKFILAADDRRSILLYDFSSSRSYSLDQLADGFDMVSAPAISDNGIGVMRIYNSGSGSNADGNILVYDFVNERKIFQGPIGEGLTFSYQISADGKYLCRDQRTVYQVLSDTIVLVPGMSDMIEYSSDFEFHPTDPELFVYRKDDYLHFKRINDLSTAYSCQVDPNGFLYNIDYNAEKFLVYSEGKIRLYDLNSCGELWSYPALSRSWGVRFCNNAVYDPWLGVRLIIE